MSLIPLSHITAALLIHKQEVRRSFFFFFCFQTKSICLFIYKQHILLFSDDTIM